MNALIVDDSKAMRKLQRDVLSQMGSTEIQEASNGLEALAKLELFDADLLLVDWAMPRMDGFTLVKRIRETNQHLPIIMISANATTRRVIEAMKAGASKFLAKPFTPDLLSQRIEEALAATPA